MTRVRLKYVITKRGRLYWEPSAEMRKMGFERKALGPDGPAAHAEAIRLYQRWVKVKEEHDRTTSYPAGTFGAYWDNFRRTDTFASKAPRTREDYERAWKHIDAWRPSPDAPSLSRTKCGEINTGLCEGFRAHLNKTVSPNERHRTIKWLKVLLADMVVRLRYAYPSPAARLVNPQPKGRSAIWLHAEIMQLSAKAKETGYLAQWLGLRIAWETMFSPVDVWTLRPKQLKRDAGGWYFQRERTKTDKEAFGSVSDELAADILAYLKDQGRQEADETPILRQRNGKAYRSKDTWGDDFRAVRKIVFPGETRQLQDIRRSANVEADAAGADKQTMGELLANGLADSRFLDETYTPPTVTKAREVAEQRVQGRAKLAGEIKRLGGQQQ